MRHISRASVLLLLLAAPALASYIRLVNNGVISGAPGDIVGWGFTIHNNSGYWMEITDVHPAGPSDVPPGPGESSPLGPGDPPASGWQDYAGINGGPDDFAIPATDGVNGYYDWTESFSVSAQTGLGQYQIDPGIQFGVQDSGVFYVQYQLWTDDPTTDGTTVGGLQELLTQSDTRAPFEINVQEDAPEPGTVVLIAAGLAILALRSRCSHRATSPISPNGPIHPTSQEPAD